ncbi:ribonuclease T2 family protein [Magnetospirillum sulfuroxidans]|uniref:Ribonuclease T2 n=1 Tax=Magnetospirillum sulfuroxidans TaxID=611300 RepID=A0ABS5IGW9_9PROT|nr:ribonuclease T2 [Magnetospirillum sulfuroxidans]MBR9973516.1 ribonuclease T2 [Magnetospirillum sulfuroxidans]
MRWWMLCLLCLVAAPAWGQKAGIPGKFDHYLLALSWSPTYCAGRAGRGDTEQCGGPRSYGFVVHGLWPQYDQDGYPVACVAAPPPVPDDVAQAALPIMPSRKLIEHEWVRHGTCNGGTPAEFFAKARAAFGILHIPAEFVAPKSPVHMPPQQVEALFMRDNPGLTADQLAVVCRGRYAAEIRVCLSKDLKFTACGKGVRDRCAGEVLFPPSR